MVTNFDLTIIGAGPAGTTCALGLKNSGLKVAIIDKDSFPRDKVCGDAIPGCSFKVFRDIAPEIAEQLLDFQKKEWIKSSKLYAPNGKSILINWVNKAYNCSRYNFDHQLLNLVKSKTNTTIYEGEKVVNLIKKENHFLIKTNQKNFTSKMLIGADGANGLSAKKLIDFSLNRNHHGAAVRAYYKNVNTQSGVNEFYLFKEHIPGYFWIFPLDNGWSNVGFGLLSKEISARKINLTKSLEDIISTVPILKEKFSNASQEGKITGFGLPLGSRKADLCGDRFMLCGDAGSLIDPLAGHGIDKAMWSGQLAAHQVMSCFDNNRFDKSFIKNYEQKVYKKFGREFKRNYFIMRFFNRFPSILNTAIWFAKITN